MTFNHKNTLSLRLQIKWLLVCCLVVGVSIVIKRSDSITLNNRVQDFITLALSVFIEAFPFIVLGSLLASFIRTFVSHKVFDKFLARSGMPRRLGLSLLGCFFPVCECGNVPLARALLIQGFKPSEAFTFLLAAPVLNPITIWATWTAFGNDSTIVLARVIGTIVIANLIGYLVSSFKDESSLLTNDFTAYCQTENSHDHHNRSMRTKIREMLDTFVNEAYEMSKMLAFGALAAGLIQTFVARSLIVGIGGNVILSIIAMLVLAFVISICANVDAFFALSFANSFTAGSIVSFLIFGPMIDIKMLILLKPTFTAKILWLVSLFSLVLSFLVGLVVTYAF